jgi:hypothetical protein
MTPKLPITTPMTSDATSGEMLANLQWILKPTKVTAKANMSPGAYLRTATLTVEL